jgi:hypothetical protein
VPGEDHGRDLIGELGGRECRAGFRIPGSEKEVEESRGWSAPPPCRARAAISALMNAVQRRRKKCRARSCGLGMLKGSRKSSSRGRPRPFAVAGDEPAQALALLVHLEREHGAASDLESEPLHRREHVDRPWRRRTHLLDQPFRRREHVRHERFDGARREGGRKRAPLVTPLAALAQEQALAEHRPQQADACLGACVGLVIVDEDAPDPLGRVHEHAFAPEERARDDLVLVGAAAPGGDAVCPHPPGEGKAPGAVGRGLRDRRDEERRGRRGDIVQGGSPRT